MDYQFVIDRLEVRTDTIGSLRKVSRIHLELMLDLEALSVLLFSTINNFERVWQRTKKASIRTSTRARS